MYTLYISNRWGSLEVGKEKVNKTMEAMKTMEEHARQPVISACPVVGIGASAGGLEAIKALLSHLPSKTGMAYVVVQHLDPNHASLLPELLARATPLPINEVEEGMVVEPDCVYICPPNAELTLTARVFQLSSFSPSRQKSGRTGVIDRFLTSLAATQGRQAVGVLLSGTGSDGTVGLQAIRAAGGITFAQNPAGAAFPQMPQSAIKAGYVDHVLSCEEIARALAQVGRHSPLSHLTPLSAYTAYLREHPDEVAALAQSVLIAVTDFFRDPVVFEALTRLVWPILMPQLERREPLRIWVPGCATGEEAYSLAISLLEFLQAQALEWSFHIFASDVNPKVLDQARTGIYTTSALATVSAERIQRFFTPVDRQRSRYRIEASIRERCVFAPHNLLHDPPFTRLDLISCRNVLMYLRASVHQQILQTFHYALLPDGFLLLGTSEGVEPLSRLFRQVESGQHLCRKQAVGGILLPQIEMRQGRATIFSHVEGAPALAEERSEGGDILQEADRLLLAHYVPASVVIDANQEIVQVRGQTSLYLELAAGHATFNLLRMARPGLSLGLRVALRVARKERRTVIREGLHVSAFGITRLVRLTVIPLKGPPADNYYLVLFEEQESQADAHSATPTADEPASRGAKRERKERRISELEQDLSTLHTEMQTLLEERDAANEDLQIANEEIQASNQELRSLNEELETSKEELQTINEELSTANQELATRNDQLKTAQEYSEAIVETARSPLVVLSEDLRIERANVAFYQFFQTSPPQTEGRLLAELGNGQWDISQLRTLLEQIQSSNRSFHDFEVEQFFPRIGRKILLLNARRLLLERQLANEHHILLALEDVTERRTAERQVKNRLDFLRHLLDAIPSSVYLVQGEGAHLVLANRATAVLWGAEWRVGQPMLDFLKSHQIRIFDSQGEVLPPAALATIRALSEEKAVFHYQETIYHADGTTLPVQVNAVPIESQDLFVGLEAVPGNGQVDVGSPLALVVHQDVTSMKEAEELKDRFLGLVAHELRTPLAAIKGFASMLLTQTAQGKGPELAEWQYEAIAEIDVGSDRLTRITKDLLDVVRLQAGRLVLRREPLDLVNITKRVLSEIQRNTDRHQLALRMDPPSLSVLLVLVDGERIGQVLANLLTNAIKYSPQGGEIEVVVCEQMERQAALISIRDQGIGIPQAEQARIFGRFFRASNAEDILISGTGLGLYLCRELILQHEGQIWFESHEGAGSTFFVRLPLMSDTSVSDATEHASPLEGNA
jgi:two-component system, chemotaxis family, CheB/CheR fusion protein